MVTRKNADAVAAIVFDAVRDSLAESFASGRLSALAYSGNSFERWLVCEVYARISSNTMWNRLMGLLPKDSDSWMEALLPGQPTPRKHIDLIVGPIEPFPAARSGFSQPQMATPAFEFKIIRDDDMLDGIASVARDVEKLRTGGLTNSYIVILYRSRGLKAIDTLREVFRASDKLISFGDLQPWGPMSADLSHWGRTKNVDFFAEAFRVEHQRAKRGM